MSKELQNVENKEIQSQPQSDLERIINAIQTIDDVEKIDKLLDLQKRHEDEIARKEYYSAMTAVQAEIPVIAKTKKNDQTHSKYAELDEIIKKTKAIYTSHGFSISFYEGDCPLENHIRIYADVSHSSGYRETKHYDNPSENTGIKGNVNMTKTHAKATATSYSRRYLMCMIWNIPTGDDTDGNSASQEYITEKEVSYIVDSLASIDAPIAPILKFAHAEKVEEILKSDYQKVMNAIEIKIKESK